MPVIKTKPTSGRRHLVKVVHPHQRAPRALLEKKNKTGGRNNQGRITTRRGRRSQAPLPDDFKRNKDGIPARLRIEYDPTAHTLLWFCTLTANAVTFWRLRACSRVMQFVAGNAPMKRFCLPIRNTCSTIHSIELRPGKAVRSHVAGTSAQLVAREGAYATIRLRSGEMRKVLRLPPTWAKSQTLSTACVS